MRINEAFGDTVNWDLIPENAIDKMTIVAGDPIFGLNALGGALNVTMKNGFTWQGFEADLRGGSFSRAQEEFQFGKQVGDWSIYLAGTEINDGGWRIDSASQLTNVYGDVGYRANGFEQHLQITAGSTQFGASVFAPIQELQNNWASVYTVPQTTYNQMAMLQWNGSYAYTSTLNFQGDLYFRGFNQAHVDGNPTSLTPCSPFLCLNGAPAHDTLGGLIPDISQNGALDLGEIDRNWTQSRTVGGSGQAVDTDKLYGHDNTFTVGASLDYGWTRFNGDSQVGTFFNDNNTSFPVIGFPYLINEPGSFLSPVMVHTTNLYTGLYGLDTLSATDRLTLTGGARFNFAGINLEGANGALLNGYSTFFHLNPTIGLTYKLTPEVNFYAGYAMSNRAPTPLELGCADPNNPCIIDNFLVSDPKLKQVVGNTFELGFKGKNAFGPWGALTWSAGLFRTTLTDDILPLQSAVTGYGYYANVGTTLRQGAELSVQWTGDRWTAYANYTYLDAVYLSTFEEPSPFNPLADANGADPDHERRPDRRDSQEHGQGRLRLQRDAELEGWGRYGCGVRPGHHRQRKRRASPSPGLRRFRPPHILPGRQAVADLWPRAEYLRPAFLHRRFSVRYGRPAQRGALPDQSDQPRPGEAFRHLRRFEIHVVKRARDSGDGQIRPQTGGIDGDA